MGNNTFVMLPVKRSAALYKHIHSLKLQHFCSNFLCFANFYQNIIFNIFSIYAEAALNMVYAINLPRAKIFITVNFYHFPSLSLRKIFVRINLRLVKNNNYSKDKRHNFVKIAYGICIKTMFNKKIGIKKDFFAKPIDKVKIMLYNI